MAHGSSRRTSPAIHKNDTQALARFLTRRALALLRMVELPDGTLSSTGYCRS